MSPLKLYQLVALLLLCVGLYGFIWRRSLVGMLICLEQSLAGQKEPEPSKEVSVDKQAVKLLLREMARLLESDLTEALKRLEDLRQHLTHSSADEEFKRLEKQVEGFDTDSAVKSVEAIARALEIAM